MQTTITNSEFYNFFKGVEINTTHQGANVLVDNEATGFYLEASYQVGCEPFINIWKNEEEEIALTDAQRKGIENELIIAYENKKN